MKRTFYQWLAGSLLLATAAAATRPHYGGSLRVETQAAVRSMDPMTAGQGAMQERLAEMMFETLVTLDARNMPQPALAIAWQHDSSFKRWQFQLRPGVRFSDGQALTAETAVASLALSGAAEGWKARAQANDSSTVIIEGESAMPNLLSRLALTRHGIAHRGAVGVAGTGPFRMNGQLEGSHFSLTANEEYWAGRPFLDSIEITTEKPVREQMVDLELGNADVTDVDIDQARHAQQEGRRMAVSSPVELLALNFNVNHAAVKDDRTRRALAAAIDRTSIHSVLLQRQGEASASLLPQWVSGTSFLFSTATQEQAVVPGRKMPPLTLNYKFADPLDKAVAERIAVNAREAGIAVQPVGENLSTREGSGDAWLVRVKLESTDPQTALSELASTLGLKDDSGVASARTAEQLYRAEQRLLGDASVVPLAYLPQATGLSGRVRNWMEGANGKWHLAEVWLEIGGTADAEGTRP